MRASLNGSSLPQSPITNHQSQITNPVTSPAGGEAVAARGHPNVLCATHHGPVYGFVAHSLGSAAVIMAMSSGVAAERSVFLGPATDPEQYSGRFARTLRIPDCVRESMKRSIERRYGVPWESFRVIEKASKMTSALMVFHDRRDSQVPFADGAAIAAAWPGAELVPTRGLGHHKILREPAVIFRAVSFLASGRAGLASETVAVSVSRSS